MSLYTHEAVSRHVIEAELAQRCPRRVSVPRRTLSLALASACAALLAGGVFAGLGLRALQVLWLERSGKTQQARIVHFETLYASSPGELLAGASVRTANAAGSRLRAEYAVREPDTGRIFLGWTTVRDEPSKEAAINGASSAAPATPNSLAALATLAQPERKGVYATVPVLTGWWLGRFNFRPASALPPDAECVLLACVSALALLGVAAWALFGASRLRRAFFLLRHGDALEATLRDKEIVSGEAPRYFVTCGFIALNGQIVAWRERSTPEQWRALQIGDAVTVLHLPSPGAGKSLNAGIYSHLPLKCSIRSGVRSSPPTPPRASSPGSPSGRRARSA